MTGKNTSGGPENPIILAMSCQYRSILSPLL